MIMTSPVKPKSLPGPAFPILATKLKGRGVPCNETLID
jgi:hypothetical protein